MPDQSANLTTLRNSRHWRQVYASTPAETVIFRALVNQTTFTYPLLALTFDTVTVGAFTDIRADMEVLVHDQSTSTIKGRLRVALTGATSTVLQVNEFSLGRLSIANNDMLEIVHSFRVRDRLVGASSGFPKDSRVAESDETQNPAPVACSGGHWVGELDAGQVYATVAFTGSTSFNVDPDSGSTVNHSWTFPSGTPSSSTSANPSVQFPAGEYVVTHTATDASNSKTETQYVWVKVHDPAGTQPTEIVVESVEGSPTDGWRVRFSVPAGWSQTNAPDGALVVLWSNTYYGDTKAAYGAASSGRSHIVFVGFLVSESVRISADDKTVSFEAISPLAMLSRLPGFSQVVNNRATATNWRGIKTLTTNRMIVYLLRWGTTLLRTHDLVLNANNFAYPAFYLQEQTTDAQIREIVDGVNGLLTCDRTGRVGTYKDLLVASTAERAAAVNTLSITADDDIIEIDIDRSHRYDINTLEGRGFTAGATNALSKPRLSLAPGTAPSEAPGKTNVEKLIVTDQTDLNNRTGRLYAKQNSLHTGLPVCSGTITLRGGYDVFDFYGEWLTLTIPASYNKRGIAFSNTRFVITGISVEYNVSGNLDNRVRLTVQQETDGAAGVTKNVPTPTKSGIPAITPITIQWPYYAPITPVGLSAGVGTIAVLGDDARWRITSDFNAAVVAYTLSSAMSITGTSIQFVVDYYSPKWLTGAGAVNGKLVTTTGIYRVTDIFGTVTATLEYSFPSSTALRSIHTGRLTQNFFVVVSNYRASGGTVIATTVDGVNWVETAITAHYNTTTTGLVLNAANLPPAGVVSEHVPGRVYVGAYTSTGAALAADSALYRVDVNLSSGAVGTPVLTTLMTNELLAGAHIHYPYHNNPTDDTFYWSKATGTADATLARTRAGVQTNIDAFAGVGTTAPLKVILGVVHPFDSHRLNRQRLVMAGSRVSGASVARAIYRSDNEGATWYALTAELTADRWNNVQFDRDNQDVVYALGTDGLIGVFYGRNFYDKSITTGVAMLAIVGN